MAESGFVVYEGGTSIFDESVLVYVARPRSEWPDFDIYDHVGRPLGHSRSGLREPVFGTAAPAVIYDHRSTEILRITPTASRYKQVFDIAGVTNCRVESKWNQMGNLTLSANREPHGEVKGPYAQGLSGDSLTVVDEGRNEVGAVKAIGERTRFHRVTHYVVSIEPTLRGELRRMLVAIPTVVAEVKRHQGFDS